MGKWWSRASIGRLILVVLLAATTAAEVTKISNRAPVVSTRGIVESLGYMNRATSEIMLALNEEFDWEPESLQMEREFAAVRSRGERVAGAIDVLKAAIEDYAAFAGEDVGIADVKRSAESIASAAGRVYSSQALRMSVLRTATLTADGKLRFGSDQNLVTYKAARDALRASLMAARVAERAIGDWVAARVPQ